MKYIDCHGHLNFAVFEHDLDGVIERMKEREVGVINVGTQRDTSKRAVELAEKNENMWAIVGIHPIHTDKSFHDEKELGKVGEKIHLISNSSNSPNKKSRGEGGESNSSNKVLNSENNQTKGKDAGEGFVSRGEMFDFDYYKELAGHKKVVGIGECGLDYYRTEPESEKKQREVFLAQIALANEVNKPLMLHVRSGEGRSAYRDALEILKREAKVGGNFHFLAGDVEEAREILDAGFNMSFTGVITFAKQYEELVKFVPLERMLSETDCPYVTPAPYRGKRNEPSFVTEVISKIAEIKGLNMEEVRNRIMQNARMFFGL